MKFQNPELILLILIIPLILSILYFGFIYKQKKLKNLITKNLWAQMLPSLSYSRRFWKRLIVFLALLGLIICLMRPQFGLKYEKVVRRGQDILFVVDTSLSMQVEDVAPNRLERAKQEIRVLINELKGDRIGLLAFAGSTFTQVPLTLDYSAIKMFLTDIRTGMIPTPGSNLAQGIKISRQSFQKETNTTKVVIIFTDGEYFEYDPLKSAELAKKLGVKIYTVGIGTKNGEPIPIRDERNTVIAYKKDKNEEVVLSKLNESILKQVATTTGGNFYFSGKNGLIAEGLYKDLSQNAKKKLEEKQLRRYKDRYQFILLIVFLLLLTDFFIYERKKTNLEWKGRIQ